MRVCSTAGLIALITVGESAGHCGAQPESGSHPAVRAGQEPPLVGIETGQRRGRIQTVGQKVGHTPIRSPSQSARGSSQASKTGGARGGDTPPPQNRLADARRTYQFDRHRFAARGAIKASGEDRAFGRSTERKASSVLAPHRTVMTGSPSADHREESATETARAELTGHRAMTPTDGAVRRTNGAQLS